MIDVMNKMFDGASWFLVGSFHHLHSFVLRYRLHMRGSSTNAVALDYVCNIERCVILHFFR